MSERFSLLYRQACDLAFKLGAQTCGCNVVERGEHEVSVARAEFERGESVTHEHADHEVAMGRMLESLRAIARQTPRRVSERAVWERKQRSGGAQWQLETPDGHVRVFRHNVDGRVSLDMRDVWQGCADLDLTIEQAEAMAEVLTAAVADARAWAEGRREVEPATAKGGEP
jgi:hypothetical protein